ncbi:hypothetical protein NL676_024291 [Syzygium grande]|nr:hypothetical protein NL676_024291 [Syzygium grande]
MVPRSNYQQRLCWRTVGGDPSEEGDSRWRRKNPPLLVLLVLLLRHCLEEVEIVEVVKVEAVAVEVEAGVVEAADVMVEVEVTDARDLVVNFAVVAKVRRWWREDRG